MTEITQAHVTIAPKAKRPRKLRPVDPRAAAMAAVLKLAEKRADDGDR